MSAKPKVGHERKKEYWLWQVAADRKLTAGALRVAITIARHMNRDKDGLAWPGIARLARQSGTTERNCYRAIDLLEEREHLQITRTRGGVNRYLPMLTPATRNAMLRDTELTYTECHPTPDSQSNTPVTQSTPPLSGPSPEPLIEPPTEPPNEPLSHRAAVSTAAIRNSGRLVGEEERKVSPSTLAAECYRLARKHYGGASVGLVARAFKAGESAKEVLAEIQEAISVGDDLGHALWRP